jgi:2-polyprenyl-6-methoxyphenol hydroxylase-like FAD-dependent oxidoreductase
MRNIGIVGAGVAGLQLGLLLREYGMAVTIYTQHAPEHIRSARITNMVIRSAPTRERERRLGVHHWDDPATDVTRISWYVRGHHPLTIHGDLDQPASIVDLRIYCARLLEGLLDRGGQLVLGTVQANAIPQLTERHDLVVIAAGRGHLTALFGRLPEHSPYDQPQRMVYAGLYTGVDRVQPRSLEIVGVRGHGEIIIMPMETVTPDATAIGIEIVAGGAFEVLRRLRYAHDPHGWNVGVLRLLHDHAPMIAERIDPQRFAIARPLDQMVTAITPTVRRAYARMPNGSYVLAVGDAHVVNDPLTGQGANNASHAAWALGETIRDADVFDRDFCQRAEARMWHHTSATTAACNARLQPPPPHIIDLMVAAAQHKPIADALSNGFNTPDRWWQITSSPERTAALLRQFDRQQPAAVGA